MAGKSPPVDGERTRLVLKYAAISRVLVITLIILWRSLLNPYDTSASIDPDCLSSSSGGFFSRQTDSVILIDLKEKKSIAVRMAVSGVLHCLFIFLPFVSFQAYGYWNICRGLSEDNLRPWCKAKPPLLYNYIQGHYWGVGFMRYFQVKQLPNFLLASPVLCLALCSIIHYVHLWPKVFFSLGLSCKAFSASTFSFDATSQWRTGGVSATESSTCEDARAVGLRKRSIKRGEVMSAKLDNMLTSSGPGVLPVTVLPFILHLSFMAATAFLVMHVQVATRFLSASPPLYWFASYIMGTPRKKKWGHAIWSYCVSYIFLGSLLFSNFYPFT